VDARRAGPPYNRTRKPARNWTPERSRAKGFASADPP
jgi:hypothetical protein